MARKKTSSDEHQDAPGGKGAGSGKVKDILEETDVLDDMEVPGGGDIPRQEPDGEEVPVLDDPPAGSGDGDIDFGAVAGDGKDDGDPADTLEKERDDLKDQLLRALAEVENIRRRTEKETSQARKYGHSAFARDLLGTVDNLERAVDALPEDRDGLDEGTKNLVLGVEMVAKEIIEVMGRHGITRIDPMGEKFDHDRHQAMFEVPTDDAEPGTVVEVARPGWMLHDRLLSPAMVGVAKKPDGGPDGGKEPDAAA